jgi:hypothetical protein
MTRKGWNPEIPALLLFLIHPRSVWKENSLKFALKVSKITHLGDTLDGLSGL